MIKKTKLVCFFALLFLLFPKIGNTQETEQPLVWVLEKLQEQYNIQFNYELTVIEDLQIIPPNTELSLTEMLQYLGDKTDLTFTVYNNFILINTSEFVVCGYLKDLDNQRTLPLATIQSSNANAVSDVNGFFSIALKSTSEKIYIRHLGYKTLELRFEDMADDSTCKDVYLEQNFQSLDEVIVNSYITKGINKINNGSFEINFTDFDILPGVTDTDVLQSIQAFPGINSSNETVSNLNIRGGTHDQNLILWDNIKMYQSGHFFGLISMYNPQITQKVSLVKNGTHVSLTDGVSGTISMTTEKELNANVKGSLGVNFIDANGFIDVPLGEKSSIQIAARKSISDLIKTPTYDKFFERISQNTEVENNDTDIINSDKEFDFYDTSFRWLYKISDTDKLRLNFINVSNDLIFNENAMVEGEEESRESKVSQNSIAGGLHYQRTWNDTWQTTLEIFETDYKLKATNANILESQRFLQENVVSETSAKIIADYKFNDRMHLESGYHFVETKVTNLDDVDNPIFRLLISEVVRTHALFSQLDYLSKNRKANIQTGLRLNYIDKFRKVLVEPRISFSQQFLEDFSVELLGELKHQNTSQIINFQNDFLGIEKRRWQLSNNKDIPIIRSKQISLGINYSKNSWLISAEGYFKDIDGITTQSQGFQNQFEFVRTHGSYRVYGVDVLFRKRIKNLNSWLSYSFMNNNYTFKNLQENTIPSNFNIRHALTFGTSYTFHNFKISAGLNWHSGKPITNPINGNEVNNDSVNFEEPNTSNLDDYFRVDLSILYDINLGDNTSVKAGLSLWNVLDRENEINRFFRANQDNLSISNQTSLGFTPNAVLRIFFK